MPSPLSQLLQYNKQNWTEQNRTEQCSDARLPKLNRGANTSNETIWSTDAMHKSNKKFLYLHYFAAGQSDSQVEILAALFPYFWSHSPVDSENLL